MTSPLRRDDRGRAADGPRRLRRPGARDLARRGRRAGPRVQPDGRRPRDRRPQRRDLVANVSHELRTPLAALQACSRTSSTASCRADPAAPRARALDQAERLGRPGRRPARPLPPRRRRGAAATAGRRRRPRCSTRRRRRGPGRPAGPSASTCDVDPPDLAVAGDPARLHQLRRQPARQRGRGTAPPAARSGSRAGADARRRWRLEVADEGPGIAAGGPRARLRAVRHLADADAAAAAPASGLAIARWVAELHGGTIRFVDPAGRDHGRRAPRSTCPRRPARADPPSSRTPYPSAVPEPATSAPVPPRHRPPSTSRPWLDAAVRPVLARRARLRPAAWLLAALGVGVLAGAACCPYRDLGLGDLPRAARRRGRPCWSARDAPARPVHARLRWRWRPCCALPVVLLRRRVDRRAVPARRRGQPGGRRRPAAARCPGSCSPGSRGRSPRCAACRGSAAALRGVTRHRVARARRAA